MGITRDRLRKHRATGGKRPVTHKKRKYDMGRPAANTKLAAHRVHLVRTRGGNQKFRALRLDQGSFSWASESISRKVRILDVVYNASNNELVRTKTLVKGAVIVIDSTPFRQWYESYYATALGRKKGQKLTEEEDQVINGKKSFITGRKYEARKKNSAVAQNIVEQFQQGRLMARIASRPGQVGRADGYILEGKELDFYVRKLKAKKGK
jgi:small subunit ribosomal protein S8e